ncbi:hypothetical protein M4D71_00785 [Niallia taxi]|uniref:hypothetical protein n=1 Tax=Niallia taxi TaxID=2499688 RepID=UPI0021A2E4C0|nr:hypothetical protein [Niallia taxi]MCT2342655.1 hypothetical protein [Niallia taxi]
MKKLSIFLTALLFSVVVLAACGEEKTEKTTSSNSDATEIKKPETKTEEPKEEVKEEAEEPKIDTSVFEYAKKIEVTNAIDTEQHITVFVYMSEKTKEGLAAQHVLKQSYDFLQQEDIKDAKTVTIAVSQNDKKTFQFTVDKDKFVPNENEPMSDLVLKASKVETMSAEVKAFAAASEWKINE